MTGRLGQRRRSGAVRLAGGVLAALTLGGGAMVAATLPFSVSASARSSLLSKALTLKTAHVTNIGTVLTSTSGLTLYHFTSDPPGRVTCTGACAKVWPPLLLPKGATKVKAPHGVKGLSTLHVADGRLQVFFHNEALYTFASDTKKGEAKGQGVGNVWFACLADGKSSAVQPASTATPPSPGAGTATTTPNTMPTTPPTTTQTPTGGVGF